MVRMTAMTLRLDDELYERVRRAAFDLRWPITRVITQAVETWLNEVIGSDDGGSRS